MVTLQGYVNWAAMVAGINGVLTLYFLGMFIGAQFIAISLRDRRFLRVIDRLQSIDPRGPKEK